MTSHLPKATLVSVALVLAESSIKEIMIGATSSGISALKSERLPLCVVYIDNIYGPHLKEQIQIVSQN